MELQEIHKEKSFNSAKLDQITDSVVGNKIVNSFGLKAVKINEIFLN